MKRTLFFVIFSFVIGLVSQALAVEKTSTKSLSGIEFLTGFMKSDKSLEDKGLLRTVPLLFDFDFDMKEFTHEKFNLFWSGLLQLQLEPFVAPIYSPSNNFETGMSVFLKIGFVPDTWKLQPFGKIGIGLDYMTLQTREQRTQFNFIDTVCLGAHYFVKKNVALTCEYRLRHLSNAGIDQPNHGINAHFALLGAAYQF